MTAPDRFSRTAYSDAPRRARGPGRDRWLSSSLLAACVLLAPACRHEGGCPDPGCTDTPAATSSPPDTGTPSQTPASTPSPEVSPSPSDCSTPCDSPTPTATPTPTSRPDDLDGDGFTAGEGDCDDQDQTVYPGACEVLLDDIDQDCDGLDSRFGSLACSYGVMRGAWDEEKLGDPVEEVGDLDQDGFTDIIIGAAPSPVAGSGNLTGQLEVLYGPVTSPLSEMPRATLRGIEPDSLTGEHVASGDFDGDGCLDLLIAAPGFATDTGRVYLIYGVPVAGGGCTRLAGQYSVADAAATFTGEHAQDSLGYAITDAGDLNHDGIHDFLLASPFAVVNGADASGEVYLFYGRDSEHRYAGDYSASEAPTVFYSEKEGDNFGSSLLSQDLDRDGVNEILVGSPGFSPITFGEGGVFVFSTSGMAQAPLEGRISCLTGPLVLEGTFVLGMLGDQLAGGRDSDGDGASDLLVAAPYAAGVAEGRGRAYFFSSQQLETGLKAAVSSQTSVILASDEARASWVGSSQIQYLAFDLTFTEDMTGDGVPDIALGSVDFGDTQSWSAGNTFLLSGNEADWQGDDPMPVSRDTAVATWQAEAPDQATGGHVSGITGWSGLLIGAPLWDSSSCSNCGSAYAVTIGPSR